MAETTYVFDYNVMGRAAQSIAGVASKLSHSVFFEKDNRLVNASSLLGVLSLSISAGDTIKVIVNGKTDEDASQTLKEFINQL